MFEKHNKNLVDATSYRKTGTAGLKPLEESYFYWRTFNTEEILEILSFYCPKNVCTSIKGASSPCLVCQKPILGGERYRIYKTTAIAHFDCVPEGKVPEKSDYRLKMLGKKLPAEKECEPVGGIPDALLGTNLLTSEDLPELQFTDESTRFGHYVGILEGNNESSREYIKALEQDKISLQNQVSKLLGMVDNFLVGGKT